MRSWSHRLRPKKVHASVAVPAAPVRVPSQRPLSPSVTSVTSVANDRVIMKLSQGLCTDLLAFALQLGKPRKTSAKRPYDEGAVDQSSPHKGSLSSK